MTQLLLIPRELRDQILAVVIQSTIISPPQSPTNISERAEVTYPNNDSIVYGVFHQKETQLEGIPTLGVNRQLRSETLAVMSDMEIGGLRSYKLDVMIVEDRQLWPTWLSVPTTTARVEEVHVTFRIHGATTTKRCAYDGGDCGPPSFVWSFYGLLNRFLLIGPMSQQHKQKGCDKHIKIRHLILDVRSPDVPEEMIAPDVNQNKLRVLRRRSGIQYIKHPKSVLDFLWDYLEYVRGTKPCNGGVSHEPYERVGRLTLMLDGVVVHERVVTPCVLKTESDPSDISQLLPTLFEEWDLKHPKRPTVIETDTATEIEIQ